MHISDGTKSKIYDTIHLYKLICLINIEVGASNFFIQGLTKTK